MPAYAASVASCCCCCCANKCHVTLTVTTCNSVSAEVLIVIQEPPPLQLRHARRCEISNHVTASFTVLELTTSSSLCASARRQTITVRRHSDDATGNTLPSYHTSLSTEIHVHHAHYVAIITKHINTHPYSPSPLIITILTLSIVIQPRFTQRYTISLWRIAHRPWTGNRCHSRRRHRRHHYGLPSVTIPFPAQTPIAVITMSNQYERAQPIQLHQGYIPSSGSWQKTQEKCQDEMQSENIEPYHFEQRNQWKPTSTTAMRIHQRTTHQRQQQRQCQYHYHRQHQHQLRLLHL
jgi:hypothetical protein